jgi:hypothetical protein
MKSITSYLDFTLTLQQSSAWKSSYEIRFGDEHLGSITMPKIWSDRAEAVSAEGNWSFERQGLLKTKLVAKAESGDILASYQIRPFHCSSNMMIGEKEVFSVRIGFFRRTLDVSSRLDERVIHFQNHGIVRLRSDITFSHDAKHIEQFPLVFFLSCYILLINRRDEARKSAAR